MNSAMSVSLSTMDRYRYLGLQNEMLVLLAVAVMLVGHIVWPGIHNWGGSKRRKKK